jgi:pSer/pThr/pTyr-binding forkhead associated (FHA) protein
MDDESQKPGRFAVETQTDKSAPGDSAWTEERDPVVTSSAVTPSVSYLVRGSGEKIRLSEKAVVIGRQTECDLVIQDSNVSRKHAEVRIMPEGATITDLGSTNGTKVNGVKITASRVLANGDAIEIGPEQVRVEIA